MLILSLWLPILVSSVALFFIGFLAWMVLGLHKDDFRALPDQDQGQATIRSLGLAPGNYMFPYAPSAAEQASPEHLARMQAGPMGHLTVFPGLNMGRNLGLTMAYDFAVCCGVAYLARLAMPGPAEFLAVLRFVSTATFLSLFMAMVSHAIWFRCRIVGHLIESLASALIVGAIFGALWPR